MSRNGYLQLSCLLLLWIRVGWIISGRKFFLFRRFLSSPVRNRMNSQVYYDKMAMGSPRLGEGRLDETGYWKLMGEEK